MSADKAAEMAPDPDEDDLSDLDDMLDEFSAAKITEAKPTEATTKTAQAAEVDDAGKEEEDFAKQLQAGMAELLGQFGSNPEMQAELENMMKELGDVASKEPIKPAAPAPAASAASATKKTEEDNFQETIRKTMERMQNSGDSASAAAASSSEEDMLAQMLKEMEKGNFPGLGGGSDEDFNKMLMGMMEQLTNKEILYEPMKDLHDKFPDWLEKNKDSTKAADMARYREQQSLVGDIVARFEKPDYSDDSEQDREFIVERMQKMQAAGSPPADLVGDLGSAQDALADMEGGCPQQ